MKKAEHNEHCKHISDELKFYAQGCYRCPMCGEEYEEGDTCPKCGEDLEPQSLIDYFTDALDIEYRIGSDREYRSCRIMVAFGGPNIYIDTKSGKVELYWWNEEGEAWIDKETIELGKNPYFEVSEFTVSKFPENLKTRILEHLKNASTNEIVSYWNTYCASICEDKKRIEYMEDLPDRFYDVKVPELYKLVRPNTRFNLCDELWSYDYAGFIRSFWADDIMEYIDLDDLVDDMIEHSEDYQFYDNLKAIFKKYENEAKGV